MTAVGWTREAELIIFIVMIRESEDAARAPSPIFLRTTRSERRRLKLVTAFLDQTYVEFLMSAVERAERELSKRADAGLVRAVEKNPWS